MKRHAQPDNEHDAKRTRHPPVASPADWQALVALDEPTLASRLAQLSVSQLCATTQGVRQHLLAVATPTLAGAGSPTVAETARLCRECHSAIKASRKHYSSLSLPSSTAQKQRHAADCMSLDREMQRVLETIVQVVRQAVKASRPTAEADQPPAPARTPASVLLQSEVLDLLECAVVDAASVTISTHARRLLVLDDEPDKLDRVVGPYLCKVAIESPANTIPHASLARILRLLSLWVQSGLLAEKLCATLARWAYDRLGKLVQASAATAHLQHQTSQQQQQQQQQVQRILINGFIRLLFAIVKGLPGAVAASQIRTPVLAQMCRDLTVLSNATLGATRPAAITLHALDLLSLLAERDKALRSILSGDTIHAQLVLLLVLASKRLESLSSNSAFNTVGPGAQDMNRALDIARVVCQLFILGGRLSSTCVVGSMDDARVVQSQESAAAFSAVAAILRVLAPLADPVIDSPAAAVTAMHPAQASPRLLMDSHQLRLCRPSLLQCLLDVMPYEIIVSRIEPNDEAPAMAIQGEASNLVRDNLAASLAGLFVAIHSSDYSSKHPHAKVAILGQKLLRLVWHLATVEGFTDQFPRIHASVMVPFVRLLSIYTRFMILGPSQDGVDAAGLSRNGHVPIKKLGEKTLQLLARLLDVKPARTALVDAGILESLVYMPFIDRILSAKVETHQMEAARALLALIAQASQDSNVRFKMKVGVLGQRLVDESGATQPSAQVTANAQPSPNGIIAFAVALVIGISRLLCHSQSAAPTAPASMPESRGVFLERALVHSLRLLTEHFGHDRTVLSVLGRPDLAQHLLPPLLIGVIGTDGLAGSSSAPLFSSLLDLLEHVAGQEMLLLDLDDELGGGDSNAIAGPVFQGVTSSTVRAAAHLLDAILRPTEALLQVMRQPSILARIVRAMTSADDPTVQELLSRIVRRLFLGQELVQEMVSRCGYALIVETLMACLEDPRMAPRAEVHLDALLDGAAYDVDVDAQSGQQQRQVALPLDISASVGHSKRSADGTSSSATGSGTTGQSSSAYHARQLDMLLVLALRILRYAERMDTDVHSLALRNKARLAVCYLGTDRLLGLTGQQANSASLPFGKPLPPTSAATSAASATSAAPTGSAFSIASLSGLETVQLSQDDATAFLQSLFDSVFPVPGVDAETAAVGQQQSSCSHNGLGSDWDADGADATEDWTQVRMRRALAFLGWRYHRHAKRESDETLGLARPQRLLDVLSLDPDDLDNNGPADTADADGLVWLAFPDDPKRLHVDSRMLQDASPAFAAMMQGPFTERSQKSVVLQDAKRSTWAMLVEYLRMAQGGNGRGVFDASQMDAVEALFACAQQHLFADLLRSCTEWMVLACAHAARTRSWSLAQRLHWLILRHPFVNLEVPPGLYRQLVQQSVQALLWSIGTSPQ
ncbi:hypothetical protein BC831DRAFT_505514 [Entophlyctis helioformis]|nr:hypothetical protein BC831DRAFT_505514 [Entophlyctis helioformis]